MSISAMSTAAAKPAVQSTTPPPAAATPTTKPAAPLIKLGNGEYTAASVSADPKAATTLGLHKEKDGNYGTATESPVVTSGSAATQSAPATLAAITSLVRGG